MQQFNIHLSEGNASPITRETGHWKNVQWGTGGIGFHFKDLQGRVLNALRPEDEDIIVVALAIAHADRCANRGNGHSWRRTILTRIPVKNPDRWSQPALLHALSRYLELLTGDAWSFEFYPRVKNFNTSNSVDMFPVKSTQAIPYSDGLDSKTTWDLYSDNKPLAVTICHRSTHRVTDNDKNISNSWIGVKVCVDGNNFHLETSYRTRSFLYFALCAIVAKQHGIQEILIPETGQAAIGAVLTPWGNDYSYYGSHPLATKYLYDFLWQLFGNETPIFKHPNIWKTKAQLIKEWLDGSCGRPHDLLDKYSCASSHLGRKSKGISKRHCGICPNCILRRVALVNAGLEDIHERDNYIWKHLNQPNLELAVENSDMLAMCGNINLHPSTTKWATKTARSSFIIHRDFANMVSNHRAETQIHIQANQLAQGLQIETDEALKKLRTLIQNHSEEWTAFVGTHIGQHSWFSELIN
jgi:hypothetical protein